MEHLRVGEHDRGVLAGAGALLGRAVAVVGDNGYLQGNTGQSVGKRVIGLRTVREADGRPVGGGAGFGRAFLHVLDFLPCGVGFLLPLWDRKRQTIADKIMGTIVIRA